MEKYSGDSSIRLPLATSRAALLALEAPLPDGQRDHVGRRRTREPRHESLGPGAVLTNTEHEERNAGHQSRHAANGQGQTRAGDVTEVVQLRSPMGVLPSKGSR